MVHTISLDISYDYYGTTEFYGDLNQHRISLKLIELYGPAGGNPYINLTGTESDLLDLLTLWGFEELAPTITEK